MNITDGIYKGHYVPGSIQFGKSSKGNEQISVDLDLGEGRVVSTFLSFSEAARPYSEERLMALGWKGKGNPLDESALTNDVDVRIAHRVFEGKEQLDVQIQTGSGRVKMKEPLNEGERAAFLARLTGTAPNAGTSKVPF